MYFNIYSLFIISQAFVDELIHKAENEVLIERAMDELVSRWNSMEFTFKVQSKHNKNDGPPSIILVDTDPIVQILEDDSMRLQVISMSTFISPFRELLNQWERNLSLVYEIIDQWMNVTQRKWLYLKELFVDDNTGQLGNVIELFNRIDITYRQILDESSAHPSIMTVCMTPNRLDLFFRLSEGLENCQKLLNDFVEIKRRAFPRFYFIGKEELLSILGNDDPTSVCGFIIKVMMINGVF